MMTDTAVSKIPMEQAHWHARADDFSIRASNWPHLEVFRTGGMRVLVYTINHHGSRGATSDAAAWSAGFEESPKGLQEAPSNLAFVPKTELGRKLWALRQKYFAEGGRLYTSKEIAEELDRRASGLD